MNGGARYRLVFLLFLLMVLLWACREPFEAEIPGANTGFIVVDGYIDVGANSITYIKLSRTTPVNEKAFFMPEQGALVTIEDEESNIFPLSEVSPGNYKSLPLSLPQAKSYRLRIVKNERTYLSEFVEPLITPEIDSISWKQVPNEGVYIYASTHGQESKTAYYKWNFDEVWERQATFRSLYKVENDKLVNRSNAEIRSMQTCWVYGIGTDLNVESSESYIAGLLPMQPVLFVPEHHERFFIRYSITVNQHVLDAANFLFYEILNKNGRLGSFFDPMPTELPSNVFPLGFSEPVVGYVGAYTTQTKRLEINESELTEWFIPPACYEVDSVGLEQMKFIKDIFLITRPHLFENLEVVAVYVTPAPCADCRLNGGTNIKPAFWE